MQLEWKNHQYGSGCDIKLPCGTITVYLDISGLNKENPYKVSIFGKKLIKQFPDREIAKNTALKIAKKWLELDISSLDLIKKD